MDFYLPHVNIVEKNHCASKLHAKFVSLKNKFDCKCTHDYAEIFQVLSEQFHSKKFFGCKYIFVKGVELEHFNKLKTSSIPMTLSIALQDRKGNG